MLKLEQTKGLPIATGEESTTNRLSWLVPALVIAALLELVLWRVFSRVGLFIPKQGIGQDIYKVIAQIGIISLNFAVILGVATLVMSFNRLRLLGSFANEAKRNWPLSVALVAIVLTAGLTFCQLALVQNILLTLFLRLSLLTAFGAITVDYWQRNPTWPKRLFIGLFFAATASQITARLVHDELVSLFNFHGLDGVFLPLLLAGEGLVLVNGFVAFLAYAANEKSPLRSMPRSPKALAGAAFGAIAFLVTSLLTTNVAQTAIVPILGLYALGYTLQLPFPLYVVGLFFFLYTIFFNLGRLKLGVEYKAAACGLLLVFSGGYVFNISNQYLFALVGALLLARPELLSLKEKDS